MPDYLSIGAIYRDEARYLREWIEFHRLVGVERFHLYDNRSTDDHLAVLAPYVESGLVTVRDWPDFPAQTQAYEDCVERHRDESRWIAFIDIDEFLFSPTGRPVAEVLRDYEDAPAVGVNWAMFGTSGHEHPPPGLVIDSYRGRTDSPGWNTWIKSIVDPTRAERCPNGHSFRYAGGALAVDENHRPVEGFQTEAVSFERLRINHYMTKSVEEWRAKLDRPMVHSGRPPSVGLKPKDPSHRGRMLSVVPDDAITTYLPALREALAPVGAR